MTDPIVTCLTVTRATPERLPRLRISLADYVRQTWAAKQLVIVVDEAPHADLRAAAEIAAAHGATLITRPAGTPLGALRNAAVAAAGGEFLCQWDDDDRHHPDRITRQLTALNDSGRAAIALADVLHYFEDDAVLSWANWVATPVGAHPGTLLWRRNTCLLYPESGAEARLGEDSVVALRLRAEGALATLAGAPHLYIYVTHDTNAYPATHHRMLMRTLGISQALLRRREGDLRAGLAAFEFGGRQLVVSGPNGPAFTLDPADTRSH